MEDIGLTLQDIRDAKQRIKTHAVETPVSYTANLSQMCDCNLNFKLETLQRCRAFKFRGALSKITKLPPGSTVCCVSAGNHSQGVALSATLCGMTSKVYMPITAPIAKVNATEGYGATVIQAGLSFEEASAKCQEDRLAHPDWIFIPPFDDRDVMAGQGTIGLEILDQIPDVDTVVVAVGGGGLAAGVATAIKSIKPSCRVIAVNASVRANTYKKFQECKGRKIEGVEENFKGVPLADGINVKVPGHLTFPIVEKYVDEFVIVSEDDIAESIALLAERAKIISEGAGAAPFAALLKKKFEYKSGEKIVCIVSGGNIELTMLSRCIDRSLFLWGRRIHFNVSLPLSTDEFIKMLELLRKYHIEIISTIVFPNANCLANHIRYAITMDCPNPFVLEEINARFEENGWEINRTEIHAKDE